MPDAGRNTPAAGWWPAGRRLCRQAGGNEPAPASVPAMHRKRRARLSWLILAAGLAGLVALVLVDAGQVAAVRSMMSRQAEHNAELREWNACAYWRAHPGPLADQDRAAAGC